MNFLQVGNASTINFPKVLLGEFFFTVMETEAASEMSYIRGLEL